jgi:membrane associated rhomboid family serine protease
MHGGFTHFFFNMFALWMFGSSLENFWGSKRFLIFYLLCGLGAAGMHLAWLSYDMQPILNAVNVYKQAPNPETFYSFFQKYGVPDNLSLSQLNSFINEWRSNPADSSLISNSITFINEGSQGLISTPTVGASGAVFGCLAAFGYLFPNTLIYLYFFVPVKAKWFVIFYAAAELWMGVTNSGGNVAHFAHLGGALIGFLLVLYWNKNNRKTFY